MPAAACQMPRSRSMDAVPVLLLSALLVQTVARQVGLPISEIYGELHALSQQFALPISTPAIVVVGQQTDGKSALIEALMGFQFNHVGGGTKTRRPIALQMQYRAECEQPRCFIIDEGRDRQVDLRELKAYIEAENSRLETIGGFEESELIVRIEYRYCPNLNIIDTPGLFTADAAASSSRPASEWRETKAASASAVRELVLAQIIPAERVILCIEDTRCWQSSPSRSMIAAVDPSFTRTVLVSTKLDTKFSQLTSASELRRFLAASPLREAHPCLLGGPFFTSVPVGRVGGSGFASDSEYQRALSQLERADRHHVSDVLASATGVTARDAASDAECRSAIGLSRLRFFLENLLRERYSAGLASSILQLQAVCDRLSVDAEEAEAMLNDLEPDRLRHRCSQFVGCCVECFQQTLSGTNALSARAYTQTLAQEHASTGEPDGTENFTNGADVALFGGAQIHRLLEEFQGSVCRLPAVCVTDEELCNALGLDTQHDNLFVGRTVCCLAIRHSTRQLADLLEQLRLRLQHVVARMLQHAAEHASDVTSLRGSHARRHASTPPRLLDGNGVVLFSRHLIEDALSSLLEDNLGQCLQECRRY